MASSSCLAVEEEIQVEHILPEWWISITRHGEEEGTSQSPIYKLQRVPMTLREIEKNRGCYEPIVVSIGPFHHKHPKLQTVQKLKATIAQKFMSGRDTRKFYLNFVEVSHKARDCYAEGSTDAFNNDEFMRMMFLDGCFLLHFIDGAVRGRLHDMKMKDDQIAFVLRDMFLLENQLPFLVLEALMSFRLTEGQQVIRKFIGRLSWGNSSSQEYDHPPHLLHLLWNEFVGATPSPKIRLFRQKDDHFFHPFRSIQELQAAGVMCKRNTSSSSLRSVSFVPHLIHGELLLPAIPVDQSTKTVFLNLVAYEASPDASSDFAITSYICLLESLIANADDVKEMRSKNIIFNFLAGDQEVVDLFHDLAANLVPNLSEYREVKLLIENHYRRKMNIVPVMLYKFYRSFRGQWTLFVYITTLVIMVIFIVQTYFAVFPIKR
ncbi:UPF0481 protein At3g47200-like [Macadamia integrifolia]|uniref:UPF0481 protein At3g47200-like n=1 Tax=Macadamia integrifolia TaxID=60698 RepID=UPI001C4E9D20|nr:UPF0481 protein At3g47200-like [Macadamia integrifolia]